MSLRPYQPRDEEPPWQRFFAALAVSLLAHVSFFSVVQLGNQFRWWDARPFSIFRKVRFTAEDVARLKEEQRRREEQKRLEEQLIFVQVTQPSDEPPPETRLYSSLSSRAANPETGNAAQPKVDGRQTQSIRTENAPRVATGSPTPPPPPPESSPQPAASVRDNPASAPVPAPKPESVRPIEAPKVAEKPPEPARQPGLGELAVPTVVPLPPPEPKPAAEPVVAQAPAPPPVAPTPTPVADTESPTPAPTPVPRARPRTVTEAKVRQALLAGEKMRQDGGVARKGPVSLDVQGMRFGAYDEALIEAVQNRWFALLDEHRFAGGATGRAVITFKLYSDGMVRIVEPHESTVDQFLTALCVRAVRDPAPYEKWPSDMARMLGTNVRDMRFTFIYN